MDKQPTEQKPSPKRTTIGTSIRLSKLGLRLWAQLAKLEGLNRTAFLEMTLRRLGNEAGLEIGSEDAEGKAT